MRNDLSSCDFRKFDDWRRQLCDTKITGMPKVSCFLRKSDYVDEWRALPFS
jgi:hypothetical protein